MPPPKPMTVNMTVNHGIVPNQWSIKTPKMIGATISRPH
jgi:hypothetical protein